MPINCFNQKYEMSSFHFQTHFHACDIYNNNQVQDFLVYLKKYNI